MTNKTTKQAEADVAYDLFISMQKAFDKAYAEYKADPKSDASDRNRINAKGVAVSMALARATALTEACENND